MKRDTARSRGAAAAAAGLAAVYLLAARGTPVGTVEDDALHLLLARALRHGSFPVNDPLPGFAAILALPAALVEPHWDALKLIGLASAAAVVFLTWRLARRFLNPASAFAAAALTAVSPLVVAHAGLILPDLPYLALSLFIFDRLGETDPLQLAAVAVGAAFLRPFGAWLVLAAALGLGAAKGFKKAALFAAPAMVLLGLWTLRNRLLLGAGSGYLLNMGTETARLAEPRVALLHAAGLLAAMGGDGLLSLVRLLPLAGLALAGAAALALAGAGAVRLLREKKDPRALAIAAYLILLAAQHLVWMPIEARYALPLVPFLWILVFAGAAPILKKEAAIAVLFTALALPAVTLDAPLVARGLLGPARFEPATMAWLAANTPADARVQSLEPRTVTLLSGRDAEVPAFEARERDAWLAASFARKIAYVHTASSFSAGGYLPPGARRVTENLDAWARSTPYAKEVFRDAAEGTAVFALTHPHPGKYLEAWSAYAAAAGLARAGDLKAARREADRAAALEPRLALAWALRGALEPDTRKRARFLDEARALDPLLRFQP